MTFSEQVEAVQKARRAAWDVDAKAEPQAAAVALRQEGVDPRRIPHLGPVNPVD